MELTGYLLRCCPPEATAINPPTLLLRLPAWFSIFCTSLKGIPYLSPLFVGGCYKKGPPPGGGLFFNMGRAINSFMFFVHKIFGVERTQVDFSPAPFSFLSLPTTLKPSLSVSRVVITDRFPSDILFFSYPISFCFPQFSVLKKFEKTFITDAFTPHIGRSKHNSCFVR